MGKAFIQESTLTDIANAIRSKNGSSDTYLPSEMAQAIQNIPTGGGSEPDYFWVEDASGAANTLTIKKSNNALPDKVFDWSLDKQTWTTVTITDTTGVNISVPANGRVYLRGDNAALSDGTNNISINCSASFNAGDDITTLLCKKGNQLSVGDDAFKYLFSSSRILDASAIILPSYYGGKGVYQAMFSFSTITHAPVITTQIMGNNAMQGMFNGCAALESVEISTKTLPTFGCSSMCQNCTSLVRMTVHFESFSSSFASNWMLNVAATGDFYNLGGATIPSGTNGIPSGWTEHTSL